MPGRRERRRSPTRGPAPTSKERSTARTATGRGSALVAIIVNTVVASSTVVAPVVAAALFPERMERRLVATRDWLTGNAAVIGAGLVILIGGPGHRRRAQRVIREARCGTAS
jgi:hypothetical protein